MQSEIWALITVPREHISSAKECSSLDTHPHTTVPRAQRHVRRQRTTLSRPPRFCAHCIQRGCAHENPPTLCFPPPTLCFPSSHPSTDVTPRSIAVAVNCGSNERAVHVLLRLPRICMRVAKGVCVCVFITTVPITKLFAWGEGNSGGHVLRETTSRGLIGLVCPSRGTVRNLVL